MALPCEAILLPEAVAAERRVRRRATAWKLVCLAIIAASFVLNPEHPTGSAQLCPMVATTHLPCPGCGITRSMVSLGHGRLLGSLRCHPLGPLVWLSMLLYGSTLFWPQWLLGPARRTWRRIRTPRNVILYTLIVLVLAFGALRLIFIYTPHPTWWVW